MRSTDTAHHRTGRGSPSTRLDPYLLDETTLTLEEWRRLDAAGRRTPPTVHPPKAA